MRVILGTDVPGVPGIPGLFFAPVIGHTTAQVKATATATFAKRDPIKIMFTTDRSNTMISDSKIPGSQQQDPSKQCSGNPPPLLNGQPEPLCDVANATLRFLTTFEGVTITGDAIGLISFSESGVPPATTSQRLSQALTQSPNVFNSPTDINTTVQNYGTFGILQGSFLSTNIAGGICYAIKQLPDVGNTIPRVIVVLSDGRANRFPDPSICSGANAGPGDPRFTSYEVVAAQHALDEANAAKAKGIIVHTITFGKKAKDATTLPAAGCFTLQTAPSVEKFDGACGDELLRRMAEDVNPKGKHFKAINGDEVLKIFTQLFIEPGLTLVQ